MFEKIVDLKFASLVFCKGDKTMYWNWALVNSVIQREEINTIEKEMEKIQRNPVIYFESRPDMNMLMNELVDRGYKKAYADSWMFYSNDKPVETKPYRAKKVENKNSLQEFLHTFNMCYQKDDPQNPYGELGDYIKQSEIAWHEHDGKGRMEYYIAYDNKDFPVAVATLICHGGIGYIANVGSLKSVRGKGFGKFITLHCVKESKKAGNIIHCLATEDGTYPNEFYKRIGFQTKFIGIAYKKS